MLLNRVVADWGDYLYGSRPRWMERRPDEFTGKGICDDSHLGVRRGAADPLQPARAPIRRKLNIKTQKSHGVFAIPLAENDRLKRLYEKYGLTVAEEPDRAGPGPVDIGEVGDDRTEPGIQWSSPM